LKRNHDRGIFTAHSLNPVTRENWVVKSIMLWSDAFYYHFWWIWWINFWNL